MKELFIPVFIKNLKISFFVLEFSLNIFMKLFGFSLLAKFLMIIAVYATYVYLPMVSEVPE